MRKEEVAALEELAASQRAVAGAVADVLRPEVAPAPFRRSDRPYDSVGLQVPRRAMAGSSGLRLLLGLPGFADLWEVRVPDDRVDWVDVDGATLALVRCGCGEQLRMVLERVTVCPGDCGRWLLPLADCVLVKRWPRDVAA